MSNYPWALQQPWTALSCCKSRGDCVLTAETSAYAAHTIDMPIDHFPNKALYKPRNNATFKQRYFLDDTYYKPGGPMYLYIGVEASGEN